MLNVAEELQTQNQPNLLLREVKMLGGDAGGDGDGNGNTEGAAAVPAAVPAAAAANVTVNVQNVTASTSKVKPGPASTAPTPRKQKNKKKTNEEVGAKIVEVLDDLKKEEEDASALDYAFASHSKRMKAFLTDSQQEECLQEIGEVVTVAIRRSKVRKLATSSSASSSALGNALATATAPQAPPPPPLARAPRAQSFVPPLHAQAQPQPNADAEPIIPLLPSFFAGEEEHIIYNGNQDYRVL